MPICIQCGKSFPNWVRVDGKRRNLRNRVRCIDCLPFGKRSDRSFFRPRNVYDVCEVCGKPNNSSHITRRKRCMACAVKIRRYRAKLAAIEYLGGKCQKCGWTGHQSGFQFHHLRDKKFTIGSIANRKWEVIKQELDKCQLLCACCHAIEHSTRDDPALIAAAAEHLEMCNELD